MLTLFFMALAGGGWATALLARSDLNNQRHLNATLPAADTDEDVLGVLEASGAEIAPKLLMAAEAFHADADWRHVERDAPAHVEWSLMREDMALESNETNKLRVLTEWLARGYMLTHFETVELAKMFKDVELRAKVRELMTNAIIGDDEE
jgi:hypothetical protein